MAERHVVINEAPPTDDDAGVAGCSRQRGVGVGRLYRSIQGAVAEAAGRGAGSSHYCVSGGPALHD